MSVALLSAVAGALTGALVWGLFAVLLGRYFLSVDDPHFLDTVTWCSAGAALGGLLAPDRAIRAFGIVWRRIVDLLRTMPRW